MAMKETPGSLRAYLFLAGIISCYVHGINIYVITKEEAFDPVVFIASILGLCVAIGFLYASARFRYLIRAAPNQILTILAGAAIVVLLLLPLRLLGGMHVGAIAYTGVGLLITWYLFVNTKRLAREFSQARATDSFPPLPSEDSE